MFKICETQGNKSPILFTFAVPKRSIDESFSFNYFNGFTISATLVTGQSHRA